MNDMLEIGALRKNMLKLCRRAAIDWDFRALCLENPGKAYLELTGRPLPEQYAVRFIEPETADIPLPDGVPLFRLPGYLKKTWLG